MKYLIVFQIFPTTNKIDIDKMNYWLKWIYSTSFILGNIQIVQTKYLNIPKTLRFATATGSFQIEGAWNVSDKAESIWDHTVHASDFVLDGSTADVTCDSYHNYKRDVEMLVELGVDYYRFSISWPRLLPTGFSNKISEDGLNYYNNLINELVKNNIKPLITLHHWDFPFVFQKIGGWTNPVMVDRFEDYARVVFELFGDRVKEWITFNEPQVMCVFYVFSATSGFITEAAVSGISEYLCLHNVLKAHARVYHLYNDVFKPTQKGKLGTASYSLWGEPESDSDTSDNVDRILQFYTGWYAHPIYSKEGDYPPLMRKIIDEKSELQGFRTSRLPKFTPEEIDYIRGTFDFMGFTYYTAFSPDPLREPSEVPSFTDDIGFKTYQKPEWETIFMTFHRIFSKGFGKMINWMVEQYGNHEIYILENGFASERGLEDDTRIRLYTEHLVSMLEAIENGCNVTLYTAWSLLDNFEWNLGYVNAMGFYEVDFHDPNRTRVPRKSAKFYRQLIKSRKLEIEN